LKWASSTDAVAKSVFDDASGQATYLSPKIQNELLCLMAAQVRETIVKEVELYVILFFLNNLNAFYSSLLVVPLR